MKKEAIALFAVGTLLFLALYASAQSVPMFSGGGGWVTQPDGSIQSGVSTVVGNTNSGTTISPTSGVSTPQVRREFSTITAAKTLAEADLSKQFDVTAPYVVRLLNPSTSYAGYFPTSFDTRSGGTFFVTSGSIGDNGTTIWSNSTGAAIDFEWTGVSVIATVKRGSWTRF